MKNKVNNLSLSKKRQLNSVISKFYNNPIARVSFELFLTIGTIMFFALFAIRPTLLTMSDLIKEIEDKKKLNQEMSKKVAALSSAQTVYQQVEDKIQVLDEVIPSSPQLIRTLKIIEKVAGEQTIVIDSISVHEIPAETEVQLDALTMERKSLQIGIELSGDYQSIRQFVEELMGIRRILSVESITFSVTENRGVKSLKARLSVNAPYFVDQGNSQDAK